MAPQTKKTFGLFLAVAALAAGCGAKPVRHVVDESPVKFPTLLEGEPTVQAYVSDRLKELEREALESWQSWKTSGENVVDEVLDVFDEVADEVISEFDFEKMFSDAVGDYSYTASGKIDMSDKTMYEILQENENFSKLLKLVNYDQETYEFLTNPETDVTFFVPDNEALTPPKHRRRHGHAARDTLTDLSDVLAYAEEYELNGGDDDDDDEERKKKIAKLVNIGVKFHTIPAHFTESDITQNSTLPSRLSATDGSFANQAFRLKFEKLIVPPALYVNGYAKVKFSDIQAKNGIIHVLNHPLFPPPSILTGLFLFPRHLSTLTSSLQKVGIADTLLYNPPHDSAQSNADVGLGAATIFAPINEAFNKLPERLSLYLFSPFGQKALKKILQYHIVPHHIVFSEWIYVDEKSLIPTPEIYVHLKLPTLLTNHTLLVDIKKVAAPPKPIPGGPIIDVVAQGRHAIKVDAVARNGAIHIIDTLLNPFKKQDDGDVNSWENWEDWLVQWAEEN